MENPRSVSGAVTPCRRSGGCAWQSLRERGRGALFAAGFLLAPMGPHAAIIVGGGAVDTPSRFAVPLQWDLVAYSARSRTPFRADGGQHSAVMADTVPR